MDTHLNRSNVILIPAFKPSEKLPLLVKELLDQNNDLIICLVDDGSGPEFKHIFDDCLQSENVVLLRHAVNIGKGGALKTGFNHILIKYPDSKAIVTADADGQHLPEDIIRIANESDDFPDSLIMGFRDFGNDIPFRSKFGNNISKVVYRYLLGIKLHDTQTGLRSIPRQLAELTLNVKANKYELETEQLVLCSNHKINIHQVPIATVYEDNNSSSHFNPFFDSLRIYFALLRYTLTSILSALADLILFIIICTFSGNIIVNNLASRYLAMFIQFFLLKSFVFNTKAGAIKLILFISYVSLTGVVSGILQVQLQDHFDMNYILAKVLVDSALFFFNFLFLRDILFNKSEVD